METFWGTAGVERHLVKPGVNSVCSAGRRCVYADDIHKPPSPQPCAIPASCCVLGCPTRSRTACAMSLLCYCLPFCVHSLPAPCDLQNSRRFVVLGWVTNAIFPGVPTAAEGGSSSGTARWCSAGGCSWGRLQVPCQREAAPLQWETGLGGSWNQKPNSYNCCYVSGEGQSPPCMEHLLSLERLRLVICLSKQMWAATNIYFYN